MSFNDLISQSSSEPLLGEKKSSESSSKRSPEDIPMPSIIAIDFGNKNCIVAATKNKIISILNNQASQRLTPSMITFSDFRRFFGIFSQQKQMENISSTITQIKQLVGLKYESDKRQSIEPLESCKLLSGPGGFTFVEFKFLGNKSIFSIEQCIAFLLKGCFDIAKLNNIYANQCVIVVSPWWSEIERRVIMDSAKVAGVKVAKLLNSTTAEAITYFMDHHESIKKQKTKYGVFIDFGDTSLNSAVIKFHENKVEVKSYCCDDNIGGSHFTKALIDYLLEVTKQKYKIDPSENHRSMIRFFEAAEKLKKGLSTNPVMPFEIDSLLNGVSINFFVERTEFEKQIQNLINCIENPIEESIKMANITKKDIFTIQALGGTSRIPAVKAKITEMFKTEPAQSVNPDECFAIGAGYQATILSPQFNLDLKLEDVFYYPIFIEYANFQENNHRKELFQKFQIIPCVKTLTLRVKQTAEIKVYCEDTLHIGTVHIKLREKFEEKVRISFVLNQSGIIEVPSVTSFQLHNNEDDGIEFIYKPVYGLPDSIITNLKEQEKKMESIDKEEEERDNVRNSLESYLFNLRNALEYDCVEFFEPSQIDEIKALANKYNDWFYENEDERIPIKEYTKILDTLKSFGDPAFKRKKVRENLPMIFKRLVDRAENCRKLIPKDIDTNIVVQINYELDQYIDSIYKLENKLQNTPCYQDISIDEKKLSDPVYRVEKKIKRVISEKNGQF